MAGITSANIYLVNDDRIVITPCYPVYFDEDDVERDLEAPLTWAYLGTVSCDVWRIEFIDQKNFDKGDALPIDRKEYETFFTIYS